MKQPENLSGSRLFLKTQKQSPMLRLAHDPLRVGGRRRTADLAVDDRDQVLFGPRLGPPPPRVIGGRGPGFQYLLEPQALGNHLSDRVPNVREHVQHLDEPVPIREAETVAGNHLRVRSRQVHGDLHRSDHAGNRAAVIHVDDRVHIGPEDVSRMEDVRIDEVDEAIAVGVGGRDVEDLHLLAVHPEDSPPVERHDGPGALRRLRHEAPTPAGDAELTEHPLVNVLLRDDRHAHAGHQLVPADMIHVHVRIDHEADRLVGDAPHPPDYALAEVRHLVVDHQDSIGPRQHPHVPAGRGRLEHVDVALDGDDVEPKLGLGGEGGSGEGKCEGEQQGFLHQLVLML